MAFLGNTTINLINLHYAIHALAQGAGGVFFYVYLLRAGVSVPSSLLVLAAIPAGRFILRPIILPLAKRFGLKSTLIFGTLAVAVQYPVLAEVQGVGLALVVLCLVSSIGEVFYVTSYHAYFAALGDHEHRGHQIGAREALAAIAGIVAPLIGGWALVTFGPRWAFAAAAVVQALAALPLLQAPNVAIKPAAPGAFRAARLGIILFVADGWLSASYVLVWQIALFVSLGENLVAYGGAMALAALVGAVGGLLLGRHIDAGHGPRAVLVAYTVVAVVVLMRAASFGSPWLAVLANAFGALAACLQSPAMMTAVYNLAKASPCPLRFHMAAEGGWDIGCCTAALCAASLSAAGFPLSIAILLSLPAAAAAASLLRRHYMHSAAAIDPVDSQPLSSTSSNS